MHTTLMVSSHFRPRRSLRLWLLSLGVLGFSLTAAAQYLQQAKLIGEGGVVNQMQGASVALSADGNTVIVGASGDSGNIGAAWVFNRSAGVWAQQSPKLVGSNAPASSNYPQGLSVALSGDGNTALMGRENDNTGTGAVWVFTRSGGVWNQQGEKLVGSGAIGGKAQQGSAVALSGDGNTALVGGVSDGGMIGVCTGAVWVFTRINGLWMQQGGKLVGSDIIGSGCFGWAVALSKDGNTALIGAAQDDSLTGAAWVFTRNNGVWTQQGPKLVGSGAWGGAWQGSSVALSADGNVAVIGGPYDHDGFPGAIWVFTRANGVWMQQGRKLVGTGAIGASYQGMAVAISGDATTIVDSGYPDNSNTGALWVFSNNNGEWTQQTNEIKGAGAIGAEFLGIGVSIAGNGDTIVAGGFGDNQGVGATWAFIRPAPTLTSLASLTPSLVVGQPATLAATVSTPDVNLAGAPAGTVSFLDAGVFIPGSLTTLSHAGEAQFTMTFTAGQHDVSAEFTSPGGFQLSSSGSLRISVARAVSRTTIAAALRPRPTLTATVSAEISSPSPSGNVSLVDAVTQTILATGSLAGGQVEFSVPPSMVQSIMNDPVEAIYSGDVNFMASASDAIRIQLLQKPPHFR